MEVTPHFSRNIGVLICVCLIAAACIAGCANRHAPDIPGIHSPLFPETTPGTSQRATVFAHLKLIHEAH